LFAFVIVSDFAHKSLLNIPDKFITNCIQFACKLQHKNHCLTVGRVLCFWASAEMVPHSNIWQASRGFRILQFC